MGLILLPYVLAALVIVIIAFVGVIKLIRNKQLDSKVIVSGIAISLLIYAGVVLSYLGQDKVWVMSTIIRFPFWFFYIPGLIFLLLTMSNRIVIQKFRSSLLISIVFSGIASVLAYSYIYEVLDLLNITTTY